VTAEALAYAWENWDRLSSMKNPVGYLYRVGQSRARRGIGIRPDRNVVEGQGWAPNSLIELIINGSNLSGGVISDAGGFFVVDVGPFGFELIPDDVVVAIEGQDRLEILIPALTFDQLDSIGGTARGTADLLEGAIVSLTFETGPKGSGEQDRQQFIDATVTAGTWRVRFNPPGSGDAVLAAWVTGHVCNGWVQVDFDLN